MKEIASNNFYTIKVDEEKNRLYLEVKGFWQNPGEVPQYLEDIENAIRTTSKGFTILSDLKTMKTPTQEVGSLHVKAQQMLVEKGLSKTAELHPSSTVTALSLKRFSEESGMKKGLFSSTEEAEQWLDS